MKKVQRLKRLCLPAFAFIAISLVFSGCVQVQFSSVFDRDGTAVHTLSVVVPRNLFEQAEQEGEIDAFDDISARAADAGLSASKIIADDTVTLRISTTRPDGEDAGAALNSLLNATGISESPGISAPFSGSFRQEGAAVGGNNFVLDMTIDGELLYDAAAATDIASGESRETVEENVDISYRVLVPGDLQDSTGQVIEPGVVEWNIDPNETITTQTETSAGDTSRTALFIMAAIASLIGVILVAALVGWILVRRPRLATSIGSAAGHFPRRTTLTSEGIWVADRVRQIVEPIWHRLAPERELPVRRDLLNADIEGSEDGADTEGDRPSTGVHRGGAGP
ncbi:MAG: hypothetical protein R3A46_21060 [Thermomicrobiales bacterium]